MKQVITIQRDYLTAGKHNWITVAQPVAEIELGRGRNWYSANKLNSAISGWFKIPYVSGLTIGMQIIFDNRVWKISAIIGQETRRQLEITVEGGTPNV